MTLTGAARFSPDPWAADNDAAPESIVAGGQAGALLRQWHGAIPAGETLPPFEELALGSLGRASDQIVLLRSRTDGDFDILRAGMAADRRLGGSVGGRILGELDRHWSEALLDAARQALSTSRPVHGLAHDVEDGVVESVDLTALPLANRWGAAMALIHLHRRDETLSLLDATFKATREGFVTLAPASAPAEDFRIIALNGGAARLLGASEAELQWRGLSEVLPQIASAETLERLRAVLEMGEADRFELDFRLEDGGEANLSVGVARMGQLLAVTLTDVRPLRRREASFRALFEENPVPMWLFDRDTLAILDVNAAAVAHYGYSRGRFQMMSVRDLERQGAGAEPLLLQTSEQRTVVHVTADGTVIDVVASVRRVAFQGRSASLAALFDVTERRRAELRIAHMAHHDALTGLPNRVTFRDRLEHALADVGPTRRRVAVLCIDLDHFKDVNDTLGHPIGDRLLERVSARLSSALRETDVVARLGGDEFAVLSLTENPAHTGAFARRLIDVLSAPYDLDGQHVVVGASVGIALAPDHGDEPDALLKNADMALYRAKADGRGVFCFFEPEMDVRMQARRALEIDLRRAFLEQELEVHYQPVVSLQEGKVTGFEALLRWNRPGHGFVSPAEIISLAEEIGMIAALGEWVLRTACRTAATWPDGVRVAVNVSPAQFRTPLLVPAVTNALAEAGLKASRLEIEITESVLLTDSAANIAILGQLRALGVRIAMDDFGTGYSSLSYLRSFPFDKIKIDRSFVRDLAEREDSRAIVGAVTGLGASLGMSTTAEGVESLEQLSLLREQRCTEVQGFLFSRAAPAADVPAMIASIAERFGRRG
jgi:diguanylate cyclase (GGDEF)-like protein/PAS domain S-box-containing protein